VNTRSQLYVGLMSGTSLDGIDAALVDLQGAPQLRESRYTPFPQALREELLGLHACGHAELHRAALASNRLATLYSETVQKLLSQAGIAPQDIAAIGCHGQTIRHRPEEGYSLQLNNAALLAEYTGICVVSDFRSRDIAAGGNGAPLVPAFHAAWFRDAKRHRTIINIGGIANLTALPATAASDAADDATGISGFDTGPGNMLLDAWAREHLGTEHDEGGALAASGTVLNSLLAACLADPYFALPPPKSTGRDRFHIEWLRAKGVSGCRVEDVQATLAELTARSIAGSLAGWCPHTQDAYVCGGGAHNADLLRRLEMLLATGSRPVTLASTEALGVHPDWVEAMAFAWLARQALEHRPGNLPQVTGARGARILGAIHPA
jgi:anhydro-N-acetylmuramic acid kinase